MAVLRCLPLLIMSSKATLELRRQTIFLTFCLVLPPLKSTPHRTCRRAGGIYDTKLMLRHWQQRSQVVDETLFPMTSLGAAYEHVTQPEFGASVQRCLGIRWREVQTQLAPGCERYQDQAFAHEAGCALLPPPAPVPACCAASPSSCALAFCAAS